MAFSRTRARLFLLFAIAAAAVSSVIPASRAYQPAIKVIYAGRLIDGVTNNVRTNVSIIIEGDRFREVRDGRADVWGAEIIDLNDWTVMPGLIDCHTHLTMQLGRDQLLQSLIRRKSDTAIAATAYARRTLLAGFTTVRDVGADGFVDVSLRDAINAGTVPGPRMFVAGELLTITGGHGDAGGIREDLLPEPDYRNGVVNTPEDGVRAVRYMVKYGADHIKLAATGGVLSIADSGSGEQLTYEEMKAIVDTARQLDRKVAAHAHGAAGMKNALRAGVASIEHGSYIDDEAISLFQKTGAYLVPTIIAGKTVESAAKVPGFFPPAIEAKARTIGPLIQAAFGRALRGGVKIAFGTDAGVYPHGRNAGEFEYMVQAGMRPIDAILSATRSAADLIGQPQNIGSVQAGRFADIVAVKGDPLSDVRLLQDVGFVMKAGKVCKRDGKSALD
ncbi:MAG TPA: amidohydrolase family protein [Blastocatellia bacterium]|nr:amidohydrolase family protein [Blastocatellia bacterium]